MKSRPNITRFTYGKTAFNGWRMQIERDGMKYTKYFGVAKYGSVAKALAAAESALATMKAVLPPKMKKMNADEILKALTALDKA